MSFADGVDLTVDLADLGVDTNAVDRGGVTAWSLLRGVWHAQAQTDGFLEGRGGVADLANGPNGFVAIGAAPARASQIISYGVFHSHDGVSWEPSPLPDQLDSTGATIAGGPLGYIANGAGVLYHSLDGVSWTDVHHFEGSAPPGTGLPFGTRPAAGRAGYAIPVPGGSPAEPRQLVRILTSRDGKTWTETSVPAGAIGAAVAVSDTSILVQPYEFGQAALEPNTGENPSVIATSAASPDDRSPSAQGPPSSAASARIEDLLACLAGQGLRPSDVQPYAPEIASAAWKPCSQLNREIASNSGLPADKLDEMAAFVDCMTQHGWIQVLLTSGPADVKAQNSASLGCRPRGPAVAVAECLRLHGLDVPDPNGGGTTLVQPYPVEKAVPAWRACRDVYVAAARIPADMVPRGIERLDCMAQHGWLTVVFTELPDDAAYDVASETCPQGFGL